MFESLNLSRFRGSKSPSQASNPTFAATGHKPWRINIASLHPDQMKSICRLMFVAGPKQLLNSRISGKCAAVMAAMCSPALLFCAILILPSMIFRSPDQHAYYYFSRLLDQDPTRWVALLLAALCVLLSLAIPATMPAPKTEIRY